MSDDAEQFINAWQTVFSQPKKRLICSWHIDGSWRKNLGKYVQGLANQAVIYQMLKSLQMELDEATFRRLLQEFVTWIDKKHPEFAEYFRKEFLERIELWASCFRVGTPANTNMVTEAFHRLLKDVYCERKQNRRVDHLLAKLLVIARDKAYESWIKQEKGKVTHKIYEMNIRHRRAKDILSKTPMTKVNGKFPQDHRTEKRTPSTTMVLVLPYVTLNAKIAMFVGIHTVAHVLIFLCMHLHANIYMRYIYL